MFKRLLKKYWVLAALSASAVVIILSVSYRSGHPPKRAVAPRSPKTAPAAAPMPAVDIARPDAIVATQSLSELPEDILKQPLLRKLLAEDLVFYYESSEGFLSLKGTVRRVAFENRQSALDELFAYVLKSPAKLAFWRSYDGRLNQYMLILDKTGATQLLAEVAKAAAGDSQFSLDHEVDAPGGGKANVYKIGYARGEEVYFAGVRDKLYIFSGRDMRLPAAGEMAPWPYEKDGAKHALFLSASYLSFGYQDFFPALEAIKFRFTDAGWETHVLTKSAAFKPPLDSAPLWSAAPKSPSLCLALPVDLERVAGFLRPEKAGALAAALATPVGVCWYPESFMYSPLVVARLKGPLDQKALGDLFESLIGGLEAGILTDEERSRLAAQEQARAAGKTVDNPVRAAHFEPPLPVVSSASRGAALWSREVSSRYGIYERARSSAANKMRSKRFFRVRLAQTKDYLLFSADDRLVDNALAVLGKRYPALSDLLGAGQGNASVIVFPDKTASLIRGSTLQSLPAEEESVFRESVSRRLFPALDRIKNFPAYSLTMPSYASSDPLRWERLQWRPLPGR